MLPRGTVFKHIIWAADSVVAHTPAAIIYVLHLFVKGP
jgi:hypothetical protein